MFTLCALHCTRRQGIEGHGFYGKCVIPVIENTARECELTDRLRQAIADYPQANAVLVRRHGEGGGGGGREGWGLVSYYTLRRYVDRHAGAERGSEKIGAH